MNALAEDLPMTTFGPLGAYGAEAVAECAPKMEGALLRQHLDELRERPGFTYLGSPYSLYALGHDVAAYVVSISAARLMAMGLRIYAPITHGHFISKHGDLPQTWAYWKEQCQPMIDAASSLIVLQMDGWEESVGLTYEIEQFAGRPIVYVDPSALTTRRWS